MRCQILKEAEQKKIDLDLKLISLEAKRVKGVKDNLLISEISHKIKKAKDLIKKLKFGEKNGKIEEAVDLQDFIVTQNQLAKSERNM